MGLVAHVLVALGLDVRWVISGLLTLLVTALIVVLIVIETVAGVLTGTTENQGSGQTGAALAAKLAPIPRSTLSPTTDWDLGTRVLELAQSWLGVPYVFGGCSRAGVDCSCLVENVYAAVGVHLPRVAVDQYNATLPVSVPQPGDLVFFANTYEPGISHVGIYVGNGQQINAPTTGEVVSIAPVFTGYWGAHYAGSRRVRTGLAIVLRATSGA
jgi:cell wall-associated NlpC family hydrolase